MRTMPLVLLALLSLTACTVHDTPGKAPSDPDRPPAGAQSATPGGV